MSTTVNALPEDKFLTIKETAAIFRVHTDTVYAACALYRSTKNKEGLRHFRFGRFIRIRYGDILSFTGRGEPLRLSRRKKKCIS